MKTENAEKLQKSHTELKEERDTYYEKAAKAQDVIDKLKVFIIGHDT